MTTGSKFHILMFPWLAMGHMTPFLHLANKLADRGHVITFVLPPSAAKKLKSFNLHPRLISFHHLCVPPVDGLPHGAQTASDIPLSLNHLLAIAMDRTRPEVKYVIEASMPKVVIYDFAHWIPEITKPLGIKTVNYGVVCAASIAIALVPARGVKKDVPITEAELEEPPPGYPSKTVVLRRHESRAASFISKPFGEGISFYERITSGMKNSDAIAVRTCREIEESFCDYISSQYNKPVFLSGPVLPEQPTTPLEDRWAGWLDQFESGSVVYCAFGSQYILEKDQFQELLLGFESTGLPFFLALKPPVEASTVEEVFPEGFKERTAGRGVVTGEWVQQLQILGHRSVGCFVNHCGFGSMWEALMSHCRIVLVPHLGDQILNTRLMAEELKVAVEVERDQNGWFSKENLGKAIKSVMDKNGEVGKSLKKNHENWKEKLLGLGLMSGYVDKFVEDIRELVSNSSEAEMKTKEVEKVMKVGKENS